MIVKNQNSSIFGTKAETLNKLNGKLKYCHIPELLFFSVEDWKQNQADLTKRIKTSFNGKNIIVRSSAVNEDSSESSMAGEFLSVQNISSLDDNGICAAVNDVIVSYSNFEENDKNQILIQEMISDVSMSGVLFTRELNSGAPYYVINYDDETGRTDTVSSGTGYCNRTLYVHRDYGLNSLISDRFLNLIQAIKEIEFYCTSDLLDIEFAVSYLGQVYLLQVRRITTHGDWRFNIEGKINSALQNILPLIKKKFAPAKNVRGIRSILGRMPDWNPAEIIGAAPRPLSYSLYHILITRSAWRIAREKMGYAHPDNQPLMTSVVGQPYIDVRLSFHSYLPAALPEGIGEKLVNAWLNKLDQESHLHDKVEFAIAITAFSFDFYSRIRNEYPGLLTGNEINIFAKHLGSITKKHIEGSVTSVEETLKLIDLLDGKRKLLLSNSPDPTLKTVQLLIKDCIEYGTIPFSILARHGFIAKSFLDSLVRMEILSTSDVESFQSNIPTVATDFIQDLKRLSLGEIDKEYLIDTYGHLRPGTYDILSTPYKKRHELLLQHDKKYRATEVIEPFVLSNYQNKKINQLLDEHNFAINAEELLLYMSEAIQAREYSKFVFTRSTSAILDLLERWGGNNHLSVNDMSFLDLENLLEHNENNDKEDIIEHAKSLITKGKLDYEVTERIQLPSLISKLSDLYVIPLLVGEPNFITKKIIRGKVVRISGVDVKPDIADDKIVLIENADPGFDWIFSRNVKGLITKYGGANSHMAIRCAEFGLPAAVGCGEQIFQRLELLDAIILNCSERKIDPVTI